MMRKLQRWKNVSEKAEFTFNDYLDSMSQMKKMGGFANVPEYDAGNWRYEQMKQIEDAMDEKKMARIEAIILSMTPAERGDPNLINPSRKRRIAGRCRCGYQRSKPSGKSNLSRLAR